MVTENKIREMLKVSPVPTAGPQELPTENKEVPHKRLVEDNGVKIPGIEERQCEDKRKKRLSQTVQK